MISLVAYNIYKQEREYCEIKSGHHLRFYRLSLSVVTASRGQLRVYMFIFPCCTYRQNSPFDIY